MYNFINIIVPAPTLTTTTHKNYQTHLQHRLPFEEVVSIVLFIEYFSQVDDRDYLKNEYINSILYRFRDQNVGRFGTDEEFLQYILDRNLPISFNGHAFLKGYRPLVHVSNLARLKIKYHRDYLQLCETVTKVYQEVADAYATSIKYHTLLKQLANDYPNVQPNVRFNRDQSIQFTLLVE